MRIAQGRADGGGNGESGTGRSPAQATGSVQPLVRLHVLVQLRAGDVMPLPPPS